MATRSCKDLKVKAKEVKISHLTNKNKLEAWGLGGLFAADWSQPHAELVKELSGHSDQKVAFPKYEYRGKPEAWTSEVWREVYNLPLGVCNEPTCLGPYLVHLYLHYNKMQNEKMEEPKKRKAREQSVSDSETEMAEEERKTNGEFPNVTWIREASGSKPLDTKTAMNFNEWRILLHNLG
ncbi:hypothetical protein R1flu_004941 [Riccia fluitans]|uniref:Uncharacterized protein n=1 Tax=Riccia fluitans TaxID=41844 RepID=A0ABD1YUS2_9MARC